MARTISTFDQFAPTGVEVQFGAPTVTFGSTGDFICQDCTVTQGGETKEYNDENGGTVVLIAKNKHIEFSINGLCSADLPDMKQGTQFTLTFGSGASAQTFKPRVQTWQKTRSNEDCAKVSMTARTYPNIDTDAEPAS